jgi:hypothetical protein
LLEALDELASTVTALMVLLAAVDMTIFLVLGGLAPRAHVSDDHRLLLTLTGTVAFLVNSNTKINWQALQRHHYRASGLRQCRITR